MRATLLTIALVISCSLLGCQSPQRTSSDTQSQVSTSQTVEAGCATCIFDMKDVTGCKLAVKIDGKAYLVKGSGIDDHGDAHASDGLCNASRPAIVVGKVKGDRFVVTNMTLKP